MVGNVLDIQLNIMKEASYTSHGTNAVFEFCTQITFI